MGYKFFSIDKQGGVGIVFLNNPPLNTLSFEVIGEMRAVFDEVEKDEGIRAMILASRNERIFGGGADLHMINEMLSSPSYLQQVQERITKSFDKLQFMPKPVIASINGHATGGGCEISLACDFRFMARGPWKIGQTEARYGLLPGAGGTQRMTRLLGRAKTTDLLLTGRTLTPDEALEIGLIDKLFEPKDLMEESIKFARRLAEGAPKAIASIKQCINAAWVMEFSGGMVFETSKFIELLSTEDAKEGISAFFNKRKPNFQGK